MFGAIFSNELAGNLRRFLPAVTLPPGFHLAGAQSNPAALKRLPPAVHAGYVHAYVASLQPVFLIAVLFGVLAFALTWLLREVPLRAIARATDTGQTYALPTARTSQEEIARALSVLASRESRRRVYERLAARAGLALDPPSTWLLFRLDPQAPSTPDSVAARVQVPVAALIPVLDQLGARGFIAVSRRSGDNGVRQITLTPDGLQARDRLVAARREGLAELLTGYSPEQQEELAAMLGRLARALLSDEPAGKVLAGTPPAPARRD